MPKVLRIINRLNLGGPTFNVSYLTKHMSPEFETLLLSGVKDDTEESSEFIPKSLGLEPLYIPEMHRELNPSLDRAAYIKIKKIIKKFKPDIVHTHAAKAGALGRLAASHCKVPVILHTFHGHVFHSYFSPVKTRFYLEVERYLAKKSTRIIAISNTQKQELAHDFKICREKKIEVIPLGFDLSKFQTNQEGNRKSFRERYSLKENEIAIGIVGRLVPVKNHELFLRSIKIVLSKATYPVRAFIIGDGEDRNKIENLAQNLGLTISSETDSSANVTFTSWIKEVDKVYAGLDIVALTSKNEGTPVSLIEAQASNKPIVSTNVGGIEDVVQVGKTALLSESGDENVFAENILKLVEDPSYRRSFGLDGWDFVNERFHYNRLVKDMSGLYNQLLR